MITFAVANTTPNTQIIYTTDSTEQIADILPYPIEQIGPLPPLAICGEAHPLIAAAVQAFTERRPLVLSPDIIWFCIAQGFANHMALHAKELRGHFVDHQGKKQLEVRRVGLLLGQKNPWEEVFAAFSQQIAASIGPTAHALTLADFSTTEPIVRAATEVLMMDTFQHYFEYDVLNLCFDDTENGADATPREGIPSITLLGTPADWQSVRQRALALGEYGLEWWLDGLRPILDGLVASAEGRADRAFWQSFFHCAGEIGQKTITGWVHVLFPFLPGKPKPSPEQYERYLEAKDTLNDEKRALMAQTSDPIEHSKIINEFSRRQQHLAQHMLAAAGRAPNPSVPRWQAELQAARQSGEGRHGLAPEKFPSALASAPVRHIDALSGAGTNLRFLAGLFGVAQDAASGALTPAFGWAVVYEEGGKVA